MCIVVAVVVSAATAAAGFVVVVVSVGDGICSVHNDRILGGG